MFDGGGTPCICIMHILFKGPTRDLILRNSIPLFNIPDPYDPLSNSLHVSCQFSNAHQISIDPSFTRNWSLPSSGVRLSTTGGHSDGHPGAWTHLWRWTVLFYVHPFPKLILLWTPSQHRHCRDPASYSSFPPPLSGEIGNLPAQHARAAPDIPILTPSLTPVLLSPPIPKARFAHLYTHLPPLTSTTPPDAPSGCVPVPSASGMKHTIRSSDFTFPHRRSISAWYCPPSTKT